MKLQKKKVNVHGTSIASPILYELPKSKTMSLLPRDYMKWFDTDKLVRMVEDQVEIKKMLAELNK